MPISLDRRSLLLAGGALIAASAASARQLPPTPTTAVASDAGYWEAVRGLYRVSPDMLNLENGYWGIMPEVVKEEYKRLTDFVNFENTLWARTKAGAELDAARGRLAEALGAAKEEVAFTRGATEALQNLIAGYNKLKPGDQVLYADLDYDAMQYAMEWLKERRGVEVVRFAIPEPATRANLVDAYAAQFKANPRVKLLLLTHVSHRTGLAMPVAEIAAIARAAGADVILDAAHSWGQMDFKVADLGVPFVGFNLHKWINAPIGCGCIYVAKDRLADIDPHYGDRDWPATDIRARIHTGTANFAAFLTVPKALEVHFEIGAAAKEARFRYLRDRWVAAARTIPGVEVLTPDDPALVAGITSFRLAGKTDAAANNAVVAALRDLHKIMTVRRGGIAKGQAIRVAPAPYTSEADIDRFVVALRAVATG